MGCDIHTYVEANINDEWTFVYKPTYGTWAESRNYKFFANLANVRTLERHPRSEPKGLPTDVSKIVRLEYESWGNDAHSASYMDYRAFVELCWICSTSHHNFNNFSIDDFQWKLIMSADGPIDKDKEQKVMHVNYIYIPGWDERKRVVFWFDN